MAFPSSVEAQTYFQTAFNNLSTTLTQICGISDTTVYVTSTTNFPSVGWITLEDEVRSYTGKTAGSFTGCTPGADDTTAAEHAAGKAVSLTLTAIAYNHLTTELRAAQTKIGVDGSAVTSSLDYKLSGVTGTDKAVSKTGTETLTYKTLNPVAKVVQTVTAYTPASTGTTTIDLSLGNSFVVTMPAATQTLALTGGTTGQYFAVEINNVTSQGALTWFTTVRWDNGTAPTLTGTNGKRDSFGFKVTGSGTYDGYIVGQNI
jgi:hypothetical protein